MEKQMTKAFVVTLPDGKTNIRRDRIPPIEFKTEKRSGHKIVTTSGAFPGELIKTRIFFHSLHARSSFEKPPSSISSIYLVSWLDLELGHSRQVNKQASSVSRRIFNACRFDSVLANQNSPQRLKNLGVGPATATSLFTSFCDSVRVQDAVVELENSLLSRILCWRNERIQNTRPSLTSILCRGSILKWSNSVAALRKSAPDVSFIRYRWLLLTILPSMELMSMLSPREFKSL